MNIFQKAVMTGALLGSTYLMPVLAQAQQPEGVVRNHLGVSYKFLKGSTDYGSHERPIREIAAGTIFAGATGGQSLSVGVGFRSSSYKLKPAQRAERDSLIAKDWDIEASDTAAQAASEREWKNFINKTGREHDSLFKENPHKAHSTLTGSAMVLAGQNIQGFGIVPDLRGRYLGLGIDVHDRRQLAEIGAGALALNYGFAAAAAAIFNDKGKTDVLALSMMADAGVDYGLPLSAKTYAHLFMNVTGEARPKNMFGLRGGVKFDLAL